MFELEKDYVFNAKMKVIGVGGAGGNAIQRMIDVGLSGVDFVAVNTDAQVLKANRAPNKVQVGRKLTRGLGAGADPKVGRAAAEEDRQSLQEMLADTDMVFITAGMGGGTGTGASPIIAEMSRSMDILTVGIVTRPFDFEGHKRKLSAEEGVRELKDHVDTLIVIPNQRLLSVVNRQTSLTEAFGVADEVLMHATKGIADLISTPGLINLDFADVKTVMSEMGDALMGTGVGEGETRATDAAQQAISSPLLEEISVSGARGVLVNITGGEDLCLFEVNDATSVIYEAAGEDANIIFGAVIDPRLKDEIRVTVIATGLGKPSDKINLDEAEVIETVTSFDHEDMDIPTFKRKEKEQPAGEIVPQLQSKSFSRDDLDVPTFLRKQMD